MTLYMKTLLVIRSCVNDKQREIAARYLMLAYQTGLSHKSAWSLINLLICSTESGTSALNISRIFAKLKR